MSIGVRRIGCWVLVVCFAASVQRGDAAEPAHLLRDFERAPLVIVTSEQRCIEFDVYIADTSQKRSNGLMFIEKMDLHEGMLFIYSAPAEISMWMKNTLLPLDMLFVDSSLRIQRIHANAVPFSEKIISSNGNVIGVIELNGGAAQRLGIRTGDRIIVP